MKSTARIFLRGGAEVMEAKDLMLVIRIVKEST